MMLESNPLKSIMLVGRLGVIVLIIGVMSVIVVVIVISVVIGVVMIIEIGLSLGVLYCVYPSIMKSH